MPLLDIQNLKVWFHTREGVVRAVDGVSYALEAGETVGIVGESGSGKSVSCLALPGLIPTPPGRIEGGRALFDGQDLLRLSRAEIRAIRGRRISMIFQDPMTALNPYMRIGDQVSEPLRAHGLCGGAEARRRATAALEAVGIPDAEQCMNAWPHEFSGGMRQRVLIAAALITGPELLIADEPTTALDVTVQAQILRLIKRLQEENPMRPDGRRMAVVLITHDLAVVAGTCERVLVMYAGRIVESSPVGELFAQPRHPYTEALLRAIPSTGASDRGDLYTIPGEPPDLSQLPSGCAFWPRCAYAVESCRQRVPDLLEIAPGRGSACLRVQEGEL